MRQNKYFFILIPALVSFLEPAEAATHLRHYDYYFSPPKSPTSTLDAAIGEGWSSDNDAPVGQCLMGMVDHVGTPSGSVSMDTLYNYNDVMNQLNFKMEGNFGLAGFKVDSSNNFTHLLKDTDYSQTFIYRASVNLKNRHFTLATDKSPLTWIGQQYVNDPVAFRANCGDKFVAEQQIGGALYVAVKFLFHTIQEKAAFNAALKVSFGSLASLNTNLTQAAETVKADGDVSVMAFQIGGDPTKLGQILGATGDASQAPLLDCELKNVEACRQMINQILVYASQPGGDNFPTQFTDDNAMATTGPGVIQNIFQNYAAVVPVKMGPSLVTQDIIDARARISQSYENSIKQTNEINALLDNNVPLSADYAQKLGAFKTNVEANNKLLTEAGLECYEDNLSKCVETENKLSGKLLPVDLMPFKKRIRVMTVTEEYLFPYSVNQYIYASGNQFFRDQVFTINHLTPETLSFTLPAASINATSNDQGATYQGVYQNGTYAEKLTLMPDFKVE